MATAKNTSAVDTVVTPASTANTASNAPGADTAVTPVAAAPAPVAAPAAPAKKAAAKKAAAKKAPAKKAAAKKVAAKEAPAKKAPAKKAATKKAPPKKVVEAVKTAKPAKAPKAEAKKPAGKKPTARPLSRAFAPDLPSTSVIPKGDKAMKLEKADKARKPKLVRDSFTIPKAEYVVLDELKQRAASLTRPTKKSELLRAGIKALAALGDGAFLDALDAVPAIKTGRPLGA